MVKQVKKSGLAKKPEKKIKQVKKSVEAIAEPNKGGRPAIDFDFKMLDSLCLIQCTAAECAAVMGVHPDTIDNKIKEKFHVGFSEYYAEKSKLGHKSLRAKQYQVAMAGDTKMLIHLGKHQLGQVDKFIVDSQSSDGSMTPTQITRVIVDNQRPQNKNLKRGTKKAGEE
jgi:hypothetical protein